MGRSVGPGEGVRAVCGSMVGRGKERPGHVRGMGHHHWTVLRVSCAVDERYRDTCVSVTDSMKS